MILRVCSYNPLICRQAHRYNDILEQLRCCGIIGLQGTQCGTDLDVEQSRVAGHRLLQWGRARGSKGRPTGVSILLQASLFPASSIKHVGVPPAKWKGRVGWVRIKTRTFDIMPICVYAPTEPKNAADRLQSEQFWGYVYDVVSSAGARTVPILITDANANSY